MKRLNYLLILICIATFCSCTITKRHFSNGYHVEWNRKIKTGTEKNETPKTEWAENNTALEKTHEPDSFSVDKTTIAVQPIPVRGTEQKEENESGVHGFQQEDQPLKQPQFQPGTEMKEDRVIKTSDSDPDDEDEPQELKRPILHPLTWAIWGSWTASLISVLLMFGGLVVTGLIGFAAGLFIGMIFGIIMIVSLRKNPEKYKYKGLSYGLAIPAIVLGGLSLLLSIAVVLGGGLGISY